jgi:hypothetical protein
MRARVTAVVLAVLIGSPALVFAGGSRREPYTNLFTARLAPAPPALPRATVPTPQFTSPAPQSASTQIVCGMTVMQGDSRIDPALAHKAPVETKPLITIVQPPPCKR